MAVAAFKSDRDALDFLYGGPAADPQLDIAPEPPAQLPVNAVEAPLPGAIEPNVQAVLDERGEPPLPVKAPEDEPLPPVEQPGAGSGKQGSAFATDEEAMAFLRAGSERTAEPAVPTEAAGTGFVSDEEARSFLMGPEKAAKEIKLPPPKPVTTPEAADGSDVKFDPKGPAFKFTGSLVVEPGTGPTAGIDGMQAVRPQGPVAAAVDPAAMEPAMNRQPRLVPSAGGQIVFDQSSPERFTQGVEEAYASGILPRENYEKIKASEAQIFKVVEDRRKLEEKAQADPRLLAVLQGMGRGGAMTAGAVGGANLGAAGGAALAGATGVGAPLIPVAAVVGGTVGAIGGGIAAGLGYDALYKQLGNHFEEYDNVMKAAELYPMYKAGGEMGMAALSLPVSVAQGVRGLMTTAAAAREAGQAVAPAVARQAAAAGAAGGVTGVAAYPVYALAEGQPITPGGFLTAAAMGVATGGFFINNKAATAKDLTAVATKMMEGKPLTAAEAELARVAAPAMRAAFAEMDAAGGRRLRPTYDAEGNFRLNDPEFTAQTTSVAGFMPRVAGAQARVPYEVPLRLPAGAVRAAQNFAASRPRPPGPAPAAAAEAAPVPREAPVNIIPPGTDVIPMPGPTASAAGNTVTAAAGEELLPMAAARRPAQTTGAQPMTVDQGKETGYGTINDSATNEAGGRADSPSTAQSAAAYTRTRSEAIRAASPSRSQFSTEFEALVEWGGNAGLISNEPPATRPPDAKGREHEVWFDDAAERVVKATYPQKFGLALSSNGEATPAQYMERIALNNALFGDDIRIERMSNVNGQLRVVTSQPAVEAPSASDPEIETFFKGLGFAKKTQGDRTFFYNKELGVVAYDAHRGNVLKRGDQIIPIDVGLQRVTPELAQALGVEPPIGTMPTEQPSMTAAADDPLISERRGGTGRPAQVPPGAPQPPPGPTAPRPAWVNQPGETSEGRRLIKGIGNYRPGQRWNFRAIVDHVNKAVQVDMRTSKSQTTKVNPEIYKTEHRVMFSRDPQNPINFHGAGHGLEYLVRARVPDFFDAHEAELLALTKLPNSMASEPPASATDAQKRQYRIGEGVGEWLRLLVTDPGAVEGLRVTPAISAVLDQFYPKTAAALRDAARAVNVFNDQDPLVRWQMFYMSPEMAPTVNDYIGALIRGLDVAAAVFASGAPVSSKVRKIFRAIKKDRKEIGMTLGAAIKKARETRATNLNPIMSAYNMILSIPAETQLAIDGRGPSKGLRMMDAGGKLKTFTTDTWAALRRKVPPKHLQLFDAAAFASEALNRYENGQMEYAGMRQGITLEVLRDVVKLARDTIPNRDALFKEQNEWLNELVRMQVWGGLLTPEEGARILTKRPEQYWPLPQAMPDKPGPGGFKGGEVRHGVYRAYGSGGPYRNVDQVVEERVRNMFESHYWNQFGLMFYRNMQKVAKDDQLPMSARAIAGSQMVKLKMPMESVAAVSKEEALKWVMEAIADAYEKVLGYRPEVKPSDVNLSWDFKDVFRPTKPGDVNVVSLVDQGERIYVQVGDPGVFGTFTSSKTAGQFAQFAEWALGPTMENWKRNITQGVVFAVRSLFRAVFSHPIMNPDPVGWVPGMVHFRGAVNKFTKKYPQVFSEGLLLSRIQPTESELVSRVRHGAIWQWLTEGFYVSQHKDPVVRTVATILQPANWLMVAPPIVGGIFGGVPGAAVGAMLSPKFTDFINLITGGRALAQFIETAEREGAAVSVLMRGGTDAEALAKYWTSAGQFNEHSGIASVRTAMRMPGFVNPMVQGLRNTLQNFTDPDPRVSGTTWLRLLALMPVIYGGLAVVRYLFMNEEDKERERQRPVDERIGFMDIGGFSIPFAFGVEGVMGSLVHNAVMDDLLSRPKVDADRTAVMLLKRIADPGTILQFTGPQLATLTEASMNWSNFRQKHIAAAWMVNLPPSEQYYTTTPEFYRKVGQMINYSPAKLQYIVQQAISRQADETIRLAESMDRGRPITEAADVPFVGRMFVRDPIGFGSQAVRSALAVDDKLRLLDERLKSKGWASLKDPAFDTSTLTDQNLIRMAAQLQYLEDLRKGLGTLSDMQGVGKYYTLARDYANERNVRTLQTRYAQSLLIGNRDELRVLEKALELVKDIQQAPPKQVAEEYLQRRF